MGFNCLVPIVSISFQVLLANDSVSIPVKGRTEHLYFAPKPLHVAILNGDGLGEHGKSLGAPAPETPVRSKYGHDDLEEKVGSFDACLLATFNSNTSFFI